MRSDNDRFPDGRLSAERNSNASLKGGGDAQHDRGFSVATPRSPVAADQGPRYRAVCRVAPRSCINAYFLIF